MWNLCTRANDQVAILVEPAHRRMWLKRRRSRLGHHILTLYDQIGSGEGALKIAAFQPDARRQIMRAICYAIRLCLWMHWQYVWLGGMAHVQQGRTLFVLYVDQLEGLFRQ